MEAIGTNQVIAPTHKGIGGMVPQDENRDLRNERATQQDKFKIDKSLTEFLNTLKKKCLDRQQGEWISIKKQMVQCRQYFDGKQYGRVTDQFEWIADNLKPNETVHIENIFQTHVQTALTELTRAKVQLSFAPVAITDSRKGQVLTSFFDARWKYYRQRLFTSAAKQQEKLSALLNGISARYTYFERDADAKTDGMPSYSPMMNEESETGESGESIQVCAECYSPKKADECPKCGSDEFTELSYSGSDGGDQIIEMKEDRQRKTVGSNRQVSVDPIGLTFDLTAQTIADSPYLIWKQVIMSEVLENKYPDIGLSEAVDPELTTQTTLPGGHYASQNAEGKQFDQCWFDYALYCNYKLSVDVKLRNGKILKAGSTLGENFPKGMYVGSNVDRILDLWGEDKNRKWTIAPYVTRIGTLVGAGLTVLISQQDRKNDIVNLKMQTLFRDTYRQEFINARYITNDEMPNDPTERAEIKDLPDGVKIVGQVIDALPPSGLSPLVSETEQQIEAAAQAQAGTFSTGGAGMPDLKAATDTLGGMQMYREQTVGRFAPMLEIQADLLDKEQAYQFFENDQEFLSPEEWRMLAGDYGEEAIQVFLDCDIRNEMIIEVVAESYMPQTTSQKQANAQGYFGMIGLMTQIGQTSPEQVAQVAEMFHQPKVLSSFQPNYDRAYHSIAVFSEIADEVIQTVGDAPSASLQLPMTAQIASLILQDSKMEVNVELDDHAAMVEGYRDWWITDAGRNAPNILKATIEMRVQEHLGYMVSKAQEDLSREMAAQQPMMEQQQQMQAQQQEQMQLEGEKQSQQEQEAAMMGGLAEMSEADAQRDHEMSMKGAEMQDSDRQRSTDLEIAKAQAQSKGQSGGK